ncbi:MAG: hypothetical protein H0U73_01280 [Tatlockia sp.]|nr:hypothetical protein [Tatlockia sp.]
MTYDLKQIVNFIDNIEAEYRKKNTIIMNIDRHHTWDRIQHEIGFRRQAHKENKYEQTLRNFAVALNYAANFLIKNREDDQFKTRQDFIDKQFNIFKRAYYQIYPNFKFKAPLPILEPSQLRPESAINYKGEAHPEFQSLIENLTAFKELQTYLMDVLHKDTRSHSYWCFGDYSVKKAGVLNQFLTDFVSLHNVTQMKEFLIQFYSERGNTKLQTRVDILSKGQNITSRIFGIPTTTMEKIEKLALSIGVDPKKIEKVVSLKV